MGFSDVMSLDLLIRAKAEGQEALKEQENGLRGITSAALAVGTVAAGAVIGFAAESVHHFEETGQAAFEMSEKFGLLPAQASQWIAAGAQVGIGSDQMATGFKFAAKNMEQVALSIQAGSKPPKQLSEAYEQLGVKIFDQHGKLRDLNSVMLDSADAMAKMPDGAEKAGLAVKLFGRSGTEMIPILNEGSAGLQKMFQSARDSGAALSKDQVEGAHKAFLAHKQFDQAIAGVANTFATALMPTITQVIEWLTSTGLPEAKKFFSGVSTDVGVVVGFVKEHWPEIQKAIKDVWAWFSTYVMPTLQALADFIQQVLKVLAAFWKAHGAEIMKVVKEYMTFVVDTIQGVLKVIKDIFKFFSDLLKGDWKAAWHDLWQIVVDITGLIVGILKDLGPLLFDALKFALGVMLGIGGWLLNAWNQMWGALLNMVIAAARGLGKAIVDGIIHGLSAAWSGITSVITNLAKSLPGPVQAVLGIHSPSSVFAEQVGLPIAQGVAAGISGGAGHVTAALGGLVTIPSVGARGASGTGTGAGSTTAAGFGELVSQMKLLVDLTRRQLNEMGSDKAEGMWSRMVAAVESIDDQMRSDGGGGSISVGDAIGRVA